MFDKLRKQIRVRYNIGMLRRIAIRAGVGIIAVLILFCYFEIKKEAIAAAYYEKNLYNANIQGRWVNYGQYEPDTLYQKTIDKIPFLHHVRMNVLQLENVSSKDSGVQLQDNELSQEHQEIKNIQSTAANEEKEGGKRNKGSLLVRYAYGNILPIQGGQKSETTEQKKGQKEEQLVQSEQTQSSEFPWLVGSNSRKSVSTILSTVKEQYRWKDAAEQARFLKNYYIADVSVGNVSSVINGEKLLSIDTSLERISEEPQILIYHTHGTEGYSDSRKGVEADTVVGMGDILCEELTSRGFSVIHDRTTYDYVNGKDNRNYAYTTARPQIEALLEEYPSIEVILDIHRDSGAARRTTINGKDTAQIMLFNGLCRNAEGPISYLPNPYLDDTLAFSLQLNLLGRERYPGLMYKLYLKNYRYNMHFTGHCMLVELGTQNNTVEEAQNGVRYLAELLYELLTE